MPGGGAKDQVTSDFANPLFRGGAGRRSAAKLFGQADRGECCQTAGAIAEVIAAGVRRPGQRTESALSLRFYRSLGRPRISAAVEKRIQDRLRTGMGIIKVAREVGVGTGAVQRIAREMGGPFAAAA